MTTGTIQFSTSKVHEYLSRYNPDANAPDGQESSVPVRSKILGAHEKVPTRLVKLIVPGYLIFAGMASADGSV